jgi:Flp pilus assembly protein TadG
MWRRIRCECGAEIIEMAIVAPLLMMLLGGIFDFGMAFRSWEALSNAAREGARIGVLPSYDCGADAQTRVDNYMAAAGFTSGTYTVQTGIVSPNGIRSCAVRVSMFQPLAALGIIGQIFGGAFTSVPLAAQSVMRTESPSP